MFFWKQNIGQTQKKSKESQPLYIQCFISNEPQSHSQPWSPTRKMNKWLHIQRNKTRRKLTGRSPNRLVKNEKWNFRQKDKLGGKKEARPCERYELHRILSTKTNHPYPPEHSFHQIPVQGQCRCLVYLHDDQQTLLLHCLSIRKIKPKGDTEDQQFSQPYKFVLGMWSQECEL